MTRNLPQHSSHPIITGIVLFLLSLLYYGHAALDFPTLFNLDTVGNFAATRYISENHKIPIVTPDNKEIHFSEIGTTRSLRPPLTFIVSAVAANLTKGLVKNQQSRWRLGSPIMAAATVTIIFLGFFVAFNHLGLALTGASMIGLLPKFLFLASCNNDDIGAILSVSLLFTSTLTLLKHRSSTWVMLAMALSFGLLLQTKFTAWLTLPWLGGFCLILLKPNWLKVLKLMPVFLMVWFVAGGWWILFNMVNYGLSDPTALAHTQKLQSTLSDLDPNRQGYASLGFGLTDLFANHDQFLSRSYKSLIGYLEWLHLEVGKGSYWFYGVVIGIGLVGVACRTRSSLKKVHYLDLLVLALVASQCAFYIHHNLLRDIQRQARYVLPIIMPLIYLFLRTLNEVPAHSIVLKIKSTTISFQTLASLVLITMCFSLHTFTINTHILPIFEPTPFYTSIKPAKTYKIEESLQVIAAETVSYKFIDQKLVLQRTGNNTPSIVLDSSFCNLLPVNALITFATTSNTSGGMYLRLDRQHKEAYNHIVWQGFPAGTSSVTFSLSTNDCTGAKITLSKRTNKLTLSDLRISELEIHQHGKPI